MENREASVDPRSEATVYEAPRLVPMGNLHDLLAGNGGTLFDCIDAAATTGDGSTLAGGNPDCNF